MNFNELKEKSKGWKRTVEPLETRLGTLYFRQFSGADITRFHSTEKAAAAPIMAVVLGWCNKKGEAELTYQKNGTLEIKEGAVEWLQSPECPGDVLGLMIQKAMDVSGLKSLEEEINEKKSKDSSES